MDIGIIGYMNWYGSMAEWIVDGWLANGHKVTKYDRTQMQSIRDDHQLYLFVDCSEDYSKTMPNIEGIKVFWAMDSHMGGGLERSVNIARKCDLTFSSNYEHGVRLLQKFGIESFLLPVTYNETWTPANAALTKKDIDVVMIGHPNSPERVKLWELLRKMFRTTVLGKIDNKEDYIDTMSRAKVVINQPTEPWDVILNNRLFEGMGFGAAVMQKKLQTSLIEKLGFEIHEHFNYWYGVDDLIVKTKWLIKNEDRRQQMALGGHLAVQKYSMQNQCLTMEKVILSKFYDRL